MPTATTQTDTANPALWRRLLNWIRALEEAMDIDPSQASIDHLKRQVMELKETVDKLQSQISSQDVERH
ncbi:MAG: hypothetical protein ACI87E_005020 [Mariniblastus sp.]|jgi:hypothetical protein